MSDLLTYAYAVVRDTEGLRQATELLRGVAGTQVHLVGADGDEPALVVSRVPAEDFREQALKQHLEDLDWLEAVARAHDGVIAALAERTTVLPFRLATVYLDDRRAREVLETGRTAFAERLALLAGHVEWGVKIYAEPSAVAETPAAPAAPAGELSPGRAYLRRRRQQRNVRDTAYRAAQEAAERVAAAGRRHAVDRVRHRVQQGLLTEAREATEATEAREATEASDRADVGGENVVNDAYLVLLTRCDDFLADVTDAADGVEGVRVEITGPWAPYSFAMPSEASYGTEQGAPP
ncbi:GvpL/GvpF family gas vesicle protein [Streptomyces mangrovisoli]|uniref:Gas vesicle protein n=1 Tax=Streptomyces mangrovisoli TaxID=1428628 RepID=A0A1J4P4H7_9ACTN|nr:GvpL/GvpF family gas vesicle protein [Streptomyces mangrovisoli]OIJ68373.1 gas vesicle protein [Streptomyces mangrovisoli]